MSLFSRLYSEPWLMSPRAHAGLVSDFLQRGNNPLYGPRALSDGMERMPKSQTVFKTGQLAYIPIRGPIGNNLSWFDLYFGCYSIEQLQVDLEMVMGDASIKRVLLDFDTPGGTVSGTPETAALIAEAAKIKKIFGVTTGMCASAGYWLMSQCAKIYATPFSRVGSVGIYWAILDISKGLEAEGIKLEVMRSGKYKALGLSGKELTDDERELVQAEVDSLHKSFTKSILASRPGIDAAEVFQGQAFLGSDAKKAGLVDATVGSLSSLIRLLSA